MDASVVRKINLIEVLQEDAEQQGYHIIVPEDAANTWTEDQIQEHFKNWRQEVVLTKRKGNQGSKGSWQVACSTQTRIPAPPDEDTFNSYRWFPGLLRSGTARKVPKLRVLCFPSAGNAEDMYTSEGTGVRRTTSPLLEWCRSHDAEVLAVQAPGRGSRLREAVVTSAQQLAELVFQVVASRLADGEPWVIISHSMGCWVAWELLRLLRKAGVAMPKAWFLSALPSPDIPEDERPWRRQETLDDKEFIEECRAWDINETVFSDGMWTMYQPLLRADFTIFDSYVFDADAFKLEGPLSGVPIFSWYGQNDRRITQRMVQGWHKFTTGVFRCSCAQGNHLWPLNKDHKKAWLSVIVEDMESLLSK